MKQSKILITKSFADYELLDSGEGEKLEKVGGVTLSRPDPQALWSKRLDISEWKKADAKFIREGGNSGNKSGWEIGSNIENRWQAELGGLKFYIKPTAFKHIGVFPEQVQNWSWLEQKIKDINCNSKHSLCHSRESGNPNCQSDNVSKGDFEVLNLFGYTGGASLACAKAGAKVVHIDGSKTAITWARENAEISGLASKPIRWILEDARTFVSREIKRERKYDGIIMDPPAFGHGPDNELWKIEEDLLPLIKNCTTLLKERPSFFLINGYSAGYSALAYENILLSLKKKFGGSIEIGELSIEESEIAGKESRVLPCGIFARWSM